MTPADTARLAGKRAYITGAAGGLGAAMARLFARHGAKVFLTDIDGSGAQAQADAINAERGDTVAWAAAQNVREEAPWPTLLEQAAQAMGGLSVLVNNAGIGALGGVESLATKDWQRVMGVNVEAVYFGCKYALPWLKQSPPGSIINISSMAAFKVDPDYTVYNASKAAVASLSKSVAIDCARQQLAIRCNSIHPAFIRTGIVEPFFQQLGEEEAIRKLTRGNPMRRLGEPDDVAYAALYLASDESRYVTATELRVDGGASAV
ncbi:SDR family oxidoreductase [Dyella lutea]|uniref:SDR family oxidoreductase n=1 Tax=Dyella lutea TaxID=2950441 RepID=A0ABT1FE46_9GAMM|nr:SDR family oxidoreductase [Dyella lutea]MCP1375661.1 SDR family oxidoreductase [Dyella lutea]